MPTFSRQRPADNPVFMADGLDGFWSAFLLTAARHLQKPYPERALSRCSDGFTAIAASALAAGPLGPPAVRAFLMRHFDLWHIDPSADEQPGLVTGFYEPVLEVSREASAAFPFPIHARPANLVEPGADEGDQNLAAMRFALRGPDGGLEACPDRAMIERGEVADDFAPMIAHARDRVDLFFVHVQGAARLVFADGQTSRMTFDGKSGHDFTGPGRLLVARGEIDPATVSMQAIRQWCAENPERVDALLRQNRSYIFFREMTDDPAAPGPTAAAKVPLTPHRSIAVDRSLWSFGLPFLVDVPGLRDLTGAAYRRLMVAQETGSAIVGAARADLFHGTGEQAGHAAGHVHHEARFHVLLPRGNEPTAAMTEGAQA